MASILEQDIKYLKGVGPARAKILGEELKVYTVRDLLFHFPRRYIDLTAVSTVASSTGRAWAAASSAVTTPPVSRHSIPRTRNSRTTRFFMNSSAKTGHGPGMIEYPESIA